MGFRINQNIAALTAARSLQARQKALAKSVERLASGQRINSGADDPAGLITSENLRVQRDSASQNIRNNERKISNLRTEDAKLGEAFNQLRSIRNRALDSLNTGGSGASARAANQTSARSSASSAAGILRGVNTSDEGVDSSSLADIARSLEGIDVSTQEGAAQALATVDSAIEGLSTFRGDVGAFQSNNLEADVSRLSAERENIQASESAIRDTDFAEATVDFIRNQVLLQANVAALSRANTASRSSLSLLKFSGGESTRNLLGIG